MRLLSILRDKGRFIHGFVTTLLPAEKTVVLSDGSQVKGDIRRLLLCSSRSCDVFCMLVRALPDSDGLRLKESYVLPRTLSPPPETRRDQTKLMT